jgi:hypothetical protein
MNVFSRKAVGSQLEEQAEGVAVRLIRNAAAAVAVMLLCGCAASMAYRADYVPDKPVADTDRITGRVLVYTTQSDDDRLVTAGATSFTGGGMKLTTPIGMMSREIALKVFSKAASDGADASHDLNNAGRYTIILRPQTQDFTHGFPQLKNLGFAITPEVRVTMRMTLLDSTAKDLLEKDYDSGVVSGSSYMISGQPVERVNKLAHEVMYDLMRAASDVHVFQQSHAMGNEAH